MKTILFVALGASLLLACPLRADEVRLKDGRVLVGVVHKRDKVWEIDTRDGMVRVPASEVELERTEQQLREALRGLEQSATDNAFSHLELARQAFAWDLDDELWRHLDAAVQVPRDAKNQGLRSRVDDFLAQLEAEVLPRRYRAAEARVRVHELLQHLPRKAGPGLGAAVQELLVREPNVDKELKAEARANHEPWRRLCAVEALLRRGTRNNDAFAWRTAILDPAAEVRMQSMQLAREYGNAAQAVEYLTPGLMAGNAEVRVRTGEAFANLGDAAAIKPLVMAGPNAMKAVAGGDSGVRGNISIVQQQAYIRDFDVEVASASFIADPKIAVLQSGVVLDVTVMNVEIERVRIVGTWRSALRRLAGSDPGANPRDWATWLARLPQPEQAAATPRPQKGS